MKEGYNDNLFKITCLSCGSDECDIVSHELTDSEDEVIGESWYIYCKKCGSSDI